MHLSRLGMSLKIHLQWTLDFCTCNHSQKAISTSVLLWNLCCHKGCLCGSNSMVDDVEVPIETTPTAVVLHVRCVGWRCAEGSHIMTDNSFRMPKQHWGGVSNSTMKRKWKWLFLNVCKCQSLMSTAAEVLNLCQERFRCFTVL